MAYHYSKSHYRLLADYGGGNDSPEQAAERKRRQVISDQVRDEVRAMYPQITNENFEAADAMRERRLKELGF